MEIQGEHSGNNLAASVWEMMELYGLKDKVISSHLRMSNRGDAIFSSWQLFVTTHPTMT